MEASSSSNLSRASLVTKCFFGWSKKQSFFIHQQPNKCASQMEVFVTSRTKEVPDIPVVGNEKIGVLLLNLGGPETLEDVQPFLFNLFADPVILKL